MKSSSRFAVAAALALGAVGMAATPGNAAPKATVQAARQGQEQHRRQMRAIQGAGTYRRRGPGWTVAHVKRMARKARNVARNRRAHRG